MAAGDASARPSPDIDAEGYLAFLLAELPRLAQCPVYPRWWPLPMRRLAVLDRALDRAAGTPGVGLEFGVFKGVSLRRSATRHPRRRFYGFDSFEGLPQNDGRRDWRHDFSVDGLPRVPGNCQLITGWFSETLPDFLGGNREPIGFVNIDCDIYSSARQVLFDLAPRLSPGTVIYFDELINYRTFLWNEMLALYEFLIATGLGVEWVAVHRKVRGVEEAFHHLVNRSYPKWYADIRSGYQRQAALILTERRTDAASSLDAQTRAGLPALAGQFKDVTKRYARR